MAESPCWCEEDYGITCYCYPLHSEHHVNLTSTDKVCLKLENINALKYFYLILKQQISEFVFFLTIHTLKHFFVCVYT